ncbi:pectin acetylesterase-family hydrolase [Paenibacillus hunanensis]|uniref:pectin acetylesterase-family hydrolase n=1 Tax=Paenibacillus hunanensis TaxID=539262 RepID=UPI002A6A12B2|nr:pectin acetylesterase-family hydrolase [Paenibacillus hunanensis]WPP40607.1 pectin acetylesterase-family hydrolase [Paenibacillus hunanensis]
MIVSSIEWVMLALIVIAVIVFIIKRPSLIEHFDQSPLYKWNRISLSGKAVSGDGSDYYLLTRRGRSNNLVVYFSGGGISWNRHTATKPFGLRTLLQNRELGYYFANIPFYKPDLLGGMLDNQRRDNPFRDWNIVYIPYATGDFHIGNNKVKYKDRGKLTFTAHYSGRDNTLRGLEWMFQHLPEPDKLFIAGASAGGFGSAFWAPHIAEHYPNAQVYHYADGSYLSSHRWPHIIDEVWKADFQRTFGYEIEHDLIGAAFRANAKRLPVNAILLQSNTVYDKVLPSYEAVLNERTKGLVSDDLEITNDWSLGMLDSARRLRQELDNYHFFITDYGVGGRKKRRGTPHTLSPYKVFYSAQESGVKLSRWLDDIVNRGKRYSVGKEFVEFPDRS